jgi:hypothetical protein
MKVIRVVKSYRNGSITFVEIVHGDTEEELKDAAEDICANDSAGQIYGYSYKWEVVTDLVEITRVVCKRIKEIYERIDSLEKELKSYRDSFPEL